MKNATLAISDIDDHAITECDGIFSSREQRSRPKGYEVQCSIRVGIDAMGNGVFGQALKVTGPPYAQEACICAGVLLLVEYLNRIQQK